jgi:hypothetical protein
MSPCNSHRLRDHLVVVVEVEVVVVVVVVVMPLVFFFCGSLESLTSAFLVISSTSRVCETLFLVVWSGWVGYPVPVLVDAARVLHACCPLV